MKKLSVFMLFAAVLFFMTAQTPASDAQPQRPQRPPVNQDSLQAARQAHVDGVMAEIKGKEKMAADSVFRNIKMLKGRPADQMLGIMVNWSKALGVGCNHCHNVKNWGSEEKGDKQLTRDMAAMTSKINKEILQGQMGMSKATISCWTCHRGQKHPANRTPQ
jgi:hypothetical protein